MKTRFRRTAVLAAGVGLLALLPGGVGTAQAAGYSPVGALQIGVHGIPAKVNRGTTITMVIWYRQTSKDNAYPVLDGLAVGTAANGTVNRAARGGPGRGAGFGRPAAAAGPLKNFFRWPGDRCRDSANLWRRLRISRAAGVIARE